MLKILSGLRFLVFIVLFPCVLSGALAEFARNIQEADLFASAALGGERSESGGTAHLISENILFYSQPLTKSRSQLNKLWRQFLALIICSLFIEAFNKITFGKHYLHRCFPRKFFHDLVVSLLLGGRAPPRFAC